MSKIFLNAIAKLQEENAALKTKVENTYKRAILDAAEIALNPGFIECCDNSYDDGVNDAKRIIADAIKNSIVSN